VRVEENHTISWVGVVNGEELERLDTTGTLTGKFQEKLDPGDEVGEITLTHLFLTTDEIFFTCFPCLGCDVRNDQLQIRLPRDFFDG